MTPIADLHPLATDLADPGFAVGDQTDLDALSADEERAVDTAIDALNRAVARHGVELALEAREIVIDGFFGGDYAGFADRRSAKPRSFRALVRHAKLSISGEYLRLLVHIGEQARQMRTETALGLDLSQHRQLLVVADPGQREQLAAEALDQGWKPAELRTAVREVLPPVPPPGPRKHKPMALEALRTARIGLVQRVSAERFAADLARMSAADRAKASAWATELLHHAQELVRVAGG